MIKLPEELKKFIKRTPTGFMLFETVREGTPDNEDYTVAFIIKDNQQYINMLKEKVLVEFVSIGVSIDEVFLIDVLMKFVGNGTIYETTVNARNKTGREAVKSLSNKDKYYVIFVNEYNQTTREIVVTNSGKEDFKKFEYTLSEWEDWSMDEFDMAKHKFLCKYPDLEALWKKGYNKSI